MKVISLCGLEIGGKIQRVGSVVYDDLLVPFKDEYYCPEAQKHPVLYLKTVELIAIHRVQ